MFKERNQCTTAKTRLTITHKEWPENDKEKIRVGYGRNRDMKELWLKRTGVGQEELEINLRDLEVGNKNGNSYI